MRMHFAQKNKNEIVAKNVNFLSAWERLNEKNGFFEITRLRRLLNHVETNISKLPLFVRFLLSKCTSGEIIFLDESSKKNCHLSLEILTKICPKEYYGSLDKTLTLWKMLNRYTLADYKTLRTPSNNYLFL